MMEKISHVYTYARHEDEAELCALELETLFGGWREVPGGPQVVAVNGQTARGIDPGRSPFLKRKIEVAVQAESMEELAGRIRDYHLSGATFKVHYTEGDGLYGYEERRELERLAGGAVQGKADMRSPEVTLGLMRWQGQWLFGPCLDNEAVWLTHASKPQNYSTALPTRMARALVNIAAGEAPADATFLDPCCGMGTVLIEALSMGIKAAGFDLNPLAVRGARVNLRHFGYDEDLVRIGDLRQLEGRYHAAIVDMPYNLCSVLASEDQLDMLRAVKRLADRAVIVTTTDIGQALEKSGLKLINRGCMRKGSFIRYASVVE
ncbi:TRM11 family SAM-dependent methyltransferase [Paenibacillus sp. CAU 1782]